MTDGAIVIAIDGPAASGKGTLARLLAAHYGLLYLDSGSLYRATARDLLAAGRTTIDPVQAAEVASRIDPDSLADPRLRDEAVGQLASSVAAIPAVRAALLDFQRRVAQTPPGAVIDGRDIGTVVCPDATAKLYVSADPATRARRRFAELAARGSVQSPEEVLRDLERRDRQDASRDAAPMRPADDAVQLDTSDLTIDEMLARALALVDPRIKIAAGLA
jgi:cytidylate kinase